VLLILSTSMPNATDLGFLLHKHPDKAQSFDVSVGTAHVLWPEATGDHSTVALLLEVDPIALVRGKGGRGSGGFSLSQYVNDRPYAASSMMSVAIGRVFRTAMTGRCAPSWLVYRCRSRSTSLPSRAGGTRIWSSAFSLRSAGR